MTHVEISIKGQTEKHEFRFPDSQEAVSSLLLEKLEDEEFLWLKKPDLQFIFPVHAIASIEIF